MNFEALIEAVNNTVVTEEAMTRFEERMAAAEAVFEEESRLKAIDMQKFLNKQYTI